MTVQIDIGIAAAACELPTKAVDIAAWGERTGQEPGLIRAVLANGLRRFYDADGETAVTLAERALRKLAQTVDLTTPPVAAAIYVHTMPHSMPRPPGSFRSVLSEIGAGAAPCFSIWQQNCVSFLAALRIARALMATRPGTERILIFGADVIPLDSGRLIDDNGIHSDGAFATLLERGCPRNRIARVDTLTDGRAYHGAGSVEERLFTASYTLQTCRLIKRLLADAGLHGKDLQKVLPHNLNLPGWRRVLQAVDIPQERLFTRNIAEKGHAMVCDGIMNLLDCPDLVPGHPFLIYSNGFGGCSGGAILIR